MSKQPRVKSAPLALLISIAMTIQPSQADGQLKQFGHQKELENGGVVVATENLGNIKKVLATIDIDQPAENIWPIIVNPYEFQKSISPRMKRVELLRDTAAMTVMKVSVDCGPLPQISYVVETKYVPNQRINFKRIDGTIKYFDGYWQIEPLDKGSKSRITYCLFVELGIPVPQWIVREALRVELPRTLKALRNRINKVYGRGEPPVKKTVLAARMAS
jgi:carbon monoxide dehydrogenase subunit G